MARKRRAVETRRPVKARGTLPAPRVAPRRTRVAWYRRRQVQIVGALVLLGAIALGVQQFSRFRERAEQLRSQRRDVEQFERSLSVLTLSIQTTDQEMASEPARLRSGELSAENFKTKTDQWIAAFKKLGDELRGKDVPSGLEEARALFVQGAVLYLDAVKVFQLAAAQTDPVLRDQGLQDAVNIAGHAGFAFGMGSRSLEEEKARLGIGEEGRSRQLLDQPIPLPEEEVISPAAPPAGSTG